MKTDGKIEVFNRTVTYDIVKVIPILKMNLYS